MCELTVTYSAQMSIEDTKLQTSSTVQWATAWVSAEQALSPGPGVEHSEKQEFTGVDRGAGVVTGDAVASFDLGLGDTLPVLLGLGAGRCRALSRGNASRASGP